MRITPVSSGLHSPSVHPLLQLEPELQFPFELQVCGVLPEHCFDPGEQEPVQTPPLPQTKGQSGSFCQLPFELQTRGVFESAHSRDPGEQEPVQLPELHTYWQSLSVCQVPAPLHVWGVF